MVMDINEIRKYLPHAYPFLLVDRVVELAEHDTIVGYKNVTVNEEFFNGHFPGLPIMPGVLITEALAQVSGILGFKSMEKTVADGTMYLFAGSDKMRFKRQVIPGDKLMLESKVVAVKRGIWKFEVKASVDGQVACTGTILCAERKA